ncbi:MAG: hypothetical protein JWP29_5536 [Rhodoferax sp.]|nr:hypothetical protein [Rhodoferax sp.]
MAPTAKAKTAAILSNLIVGVFTILTLAVWLLDPTSVRSNLQATVGCIAAYIGARLASHSDLR